MLPIHYYKKLLSVENDDYAIYAESSLPRENRLLLLGNDVSTKYTMRGADMYEKFARYILNIVEGRKGNYMVFCSRPTGLWRMYRESFSEYDAGAQRHRMYCAVAVFMGEEAREIFLEDIRRRAGVQAAWDSA